MRALLALIALVLAGIAPAVGQSSTCTLTASGLNLGIYTGALSTSGVGMVTATRPANTPYQIGLNAGTGVAATTTTRQAGGPVAPSLSYQMFPTLDRTATWGNTAGVDTVTATGTGATQVMSIYPKIAAGQSAAPGTFTDTITASLFGPNDPVSTLLVTATILPTCTVSAAPLAFGTYAGQQLTAATTVTVVCTNTTAWNLGLDAGVASGATVTTRRMTGPHEATLAYGLFLDSAYTRQWGVTLSIDTATGTGSGAPQAVQVYGMIPQGAYGEPGFYADTITATVSY